MSTQILFDTTGRRLTDRSLMKPESAQIGLGKAGTKNTPKNKNISIEAPESASEKIKSSLIQSLNRKIDYHIHRESNKIIIKVRNGETGEVIRQIPQEEFTRLIDRISEFNESTLDETA